MVHSSRIQRVGNMALISSQVGGRVEDLRRQQPYNTFYRRFLVISRHTVPPFQCQYLDAPRKPTDIAKTSPWLLIQGKMRFTANLTLLDKDNAEKGPL